MDPLSLALGAFGILGSAFSSFSTNESNAKENERNRQFNHDEAILDRDWQEKMINQQNEYNSYANQVKLMREAGINPNNMLGGLSGSAISTGASAHGAQASSGPSHAKQPIDLSQLANLGLVASQTRLNDANASNINSDTEQKNIETSVLKFNFNLDQKYSELERVINLDSVDSKRALDDSQRWVNNSIYKLNLDQLHNMNPVQRSNIIADSVLKESSDLVNRAAAAKTYEEAKLVYAEYLLRVAATNSVISLNNASIREKNENAFYLGTLGKSAHLDYIQNALFWNGNYKDILENWKTSVTKQKNLNGSYNYDTDTWYGKLFQFGDGLIDRASNIFSGGIIYSGKMPGSSSHSPVRGFGN